MGKLADVINGMRYEYPEFTAYLKYYRFHVANFFRRSEAQGRSQPPQN